MARTNSAAPGFFSRALRGSLYHEYEHKTTLCRSSEKSLDEVFALLLSNVQYIAPTDQTKPVVSGMTVDVYLALCGVVFSRHNPISVTVNASNHSVVNTTRPGHMLHPGRVTRQLEETDGEIVMHTRGVGTGIAQGSLNYIFCSPLLDHLVSRAYTPSGIANNLAAWDVWGAVDQKLKDRIKGHTAPFTPGGGSFGGGGATGRG